MKVFIEITLASFKVSWAKILIYKANEELHWQKKSFLTRSNKVTDTNVVYYEKDKVKASLNASKIKISRSYRKETGETTKGEYDEVEKLFNEIN